MREKKMNQTEIKDRTNLCIQKEKQIMEVGHNCLVDRRVDDRLDLLLQSYFDKTECVLPSSYSRMTSVCLDVVSPLSNISVHMCDSPSICSVVILLLRLRQAFPTWSASSTPIQHQELALTGDRLLCHLTSRASELSFTETHRRDVEKLPTSEYVVLLLWGKGRGI